MSRRGGIFALLTANGISALGTRMSMLAIPWFVLTTSGSAAETGIVAAAETAPYVLLMALGGPWVDRIGAWRVAIASELIAGVAMGAIPLLYLSDLLSLPLLALLAAVAGAVRGAGDTGNRVLLPALAESAAMPLERASGLFDGVSRIASMVGVPLAGVLIAATSAPAVIALDAASFFVSALLIVATVPRSAQPARDPAESTAGYVAQLAGGVRYLRGDRLLLGIGLMVFVTNLIDAASGSVLLPVWGDERLGSPVGIGLISGVFGLGAVTGNAVLTWLAPKLPRRMVYGVGFLIGGAPRYLAMALFSTVEPMLVVAFVAGFGAGSINPILGAVEFERIPRHLQARVLGAVGAMAWAGIPIGGLLAGALVEAIGLTPTLLAAGAIYLAATLAPFIFPAWREMDRRPAAVEERAAA
ncbi:MAG TPA: MFS transporter [Candidatus Limnocylindria bacterium]|nr:MFS transporter [Candidatus Limnocylindria bacterium]